MKNYHVTATLGKELPLLTKGDKESQTPVKTLTVTLNQSAYTLSDLTDPVDLTSELFNLKTEHGWQHFEPTCVEIELAPVILS